MNCLIGAINSANDKANSVENLKTGEFGAVPKVAAEYRDQGAFHSPIAYTAPYLAAQGCHGSSSVVRFARDAVTSHISSAQTTTTARARHESTPPSSLASSAAMPSSPAPSLEFVRPHHSRCLAEIDTLHRRDVSSSTSSHVQLTE